MDFAALAKVLLFVAIALSAWPAVRRQWRDDRPGFFRTLKLTGVFILYCALGLAALIALMPPPSGPTDPNTAIVFALVTFILAWIFLGALWLARSVPRYKSVPAWIDRRFGPVEMTLWGAIALSVLIRFLA